MRSFKNLIVLILTLFTLVSVAKAEYFTDIIVTSPDGIWTDERAYASLEDAISAVGSNNRTIVVASEETVTDLVIPSNVTLDFRRGGKISYTGQLTINTPSIIASDCVIFNPSGLGEVDFAKGTNLRTTWFNNLDEAFDQTSDNYVTLIVNSGWDAGITTDATVGDNVTLKWEGSGHRILAPAGVTLTVYSPENIEAGARHQIFTGAGTLTFTFAGKIFPEWYGAKGDGSTNDHTAIEAAAAAASDCGGEVYLSQRIYATESEIYVPSGCDFICDGTILYTGGGGETTLTIGAPKPAAINIGRKIRVKVERSSLSDWTDTTDVGVEIINLFRSTVWIDLVKNYTIGAKFSGIDSGFVYNNVHLLDINNNRYGLYLYAHANTSTGWVNENLFLGGSFKNSSLSNPTVARTGIIITSNNGYYSNSNVFLKPSFELAGKTASGETTLIDIEYGVLNTVISARNESSPDYTVKIRNDSCGNKIEFTNGAKLTPTSISDTSDTKENEVLQKAFSARNPTISFRDYPVVFDVSDLHLKAFYYGEGFTQIAAPVEFMDIHGNHAGHMSLIPIHRDYITISNKRSIGVYIDTTSTKKFVVLAKEKYNGDGGRYQMSCFAADGTRLTGTSPKYASGTEYASWGTVYRTGSDLPAYFFTVHPDVKYVFFSLSSFEYLQGFTVYALDQSNSSTPGFWVDKNRIGAMGLNITSAKPTMGAHLSYVGRRVYLDPPVSGSPQGWVCDSSIETTIGSNEASGQTVITVSDATGIESGDLIAIKVDDGTWHETTVDGAPSGNDVTITDALDDDAAAGNEVFVSDWIAMPNY